MSFSVDDRGTGPAWTHIEALADDTCHGNIPLGFTFTGFGASTSTISVSSNGVLFFGQSCNNVAGNTALPATISSNPLLAFFWDDFEDYGGGEYMQYSTQGSAGGRVFHLYFRNRLKGVCGSDAQSILITVHEGSNLVKATYAGFSGCLQMRASAATLGFQSAGGAGADAVLVGFNVPLLDDNASRQTMSFQPPR